MLIVIFKLLSSKKASFAAAGVMNGEDENDYCDGVRGYRLSLSSEQGKAYDKYT